MWMTRRSVTLILVEDIIANESHVRVEKELRCGRSVREKGIEDAVPQVRAYSHS